MQLKIHVFTSVFNTFRFVFIARCTVFVYHERMVTLQATEKMRKRHCASANSIYVHAILCFRELTPFCRIAATEILAYILLTPELVCANKKKIFPFFHFILVGLSHSQSTSANMSGHLTLQFIRKKKKDFQFRYIIHGNRNKTTSKFSGPNCEKVPIRLQLYSLFALKS